MIGRMDIDPRRRGDSSPSGSARRRSARRDVWFRKDDAFDATIRERFGAAIAAARAGAYGEWCATPRGALARILLLDQFTRNAYRGTPDAFAGDARALATAEDAVADGHDRALEPVERQIHVPALRARRGSRRAGALARALRRAGAPSPAAPT